jgi:hypothetical protein
MRAICLSSPMVSTRLDYKAPGLVRPCPARSPTQRPSLESSSTPPLASKRAVLCPLPPASTCLARLKGQPSSPRPLRPPQVLFAMPHNLPMAHRTLPSTRPQHDPMPDHNLPPPAFANAALPTAGPTLWRARSALPASPTSTSMMPRQIPASASRRLPGSSAALT